MTIKLPPGRSEDRQQSGFTGDNDRRKRFAFGGPSGGMMGGSGSGGSSRTASSSSPSQGGGNSSGVGGGGGGGGGSSGTRGSSTGSVGSGNGSNASGNSGGGVGSNSSSGNQSGVGGGGGGGGGATGTRGSSTGPVGSGNGTNAPGNVGGGGGGSIGGTPTRTPSTPRAPPGASPVGADRDGGSRAPVGSNAPAARAPASVGPGGGSLSAPSRTASSVANQTYGPSQPMRGMTADAPLSQPPAGLSYGNPIRQPQTVNTEDKVSLPQRAPTEINIPGGGLPVGPSLAGDPPPAAPSGMFGPRAQPPGTGYLNDLSDIGVNPGPVGALSESYTAGPYGGMVPGGFVADNPMKGDYAGPPRSVGSLFSSPPPSAASSAPPVSAPPPSRADTARALGTMDDGSIPRTPGNSLGVRPAYGGALVDQDFLDNFDNDARASMQATLSPPRAPTEISIPGGGLPVSGSLGPPRSPPPAAPGPGRAFGESYNDSLPPGYRDAYLNEKILSIENYPEEIDIPGGGLPVAFDNFPDTSISQGRIPLSQPPSQYDPPSTWRGKALKQAVDGFGRVLPFGLGTGINQLSKWANQGLTPGDIAQRDLDGYLGMTDAEKAAYNARANARRQAEADRGGRGEHIPPRQSYSGVPSASLQAPGPVGGGPAAPPPYQPPAPPVEAARRRLANPVDPYNYGYGQEHSYFTYGA